MDKNKLAYDLALICTKRYLDEMKQGDTSSEFVFSSGGDLTDRALSVFRTFYINLKHDPNLTSID